MRYHVFHDPVYKQHNAVLTCLFHQCCNPISFPSITKLSDINITMFCKLSSMSLFNWLIAVFLCILNTVSVSLSLGSNSFLTMLKLSFAFLSNLLQAQVCSICACRICTVIYIVTLRTFHVTYLWHANYRETYGHAVSQSWNCKLRCGNDNSYWLQGHEITRWLDDRSFITEFSSIHTTIEASLKADGHHYLPPRKYPRHKQELFTFLAW